MAKDKNIQFVCGECGTEYLRWQGKCDACGAWNSLKEFRATLGRKTSARFKNTDLEILRLGELSNIAGDSRLATGIAEFDRVLGGGVVGGSLILLAGDPGIGKSTLILQLSTKMPGDKKIFYVSGEESASQIKIRAGRIGKPTNDLYVVCSNSLEAILEAIDKESPDFVVIDSIQTVTSDSVEGGVGSVSQVKYAAEEFMKIAKAKNIPILLIGHVTKEGVVAGPRTLEHLVDVVLYLEGDRYGSFRVLRGIKNRFGNTSEVGVFEMAERGLLEVENPSEIFLQNKIEAPGSVVTAAVEGTRPILIEVQALAAITKFGYPKRAANGFDLNRLQLILAVLAKRAGVNTATFDIFINIVGGLRISDPSVDLPVALAVASAIKNKAIVEDMIICGEVGLSGEIRAVKDLEKRVKEASRMGYASFIAPAQSVKIRQEAIKVIYVKTIREAIERTIG